MVEKAIGTYIHCDSPARTTIVRGMIRQWAKVAKGRARVKRLVMRAWRIMGARFVLWTRLNTAHKPQRREERGRDTHDAGATTDG